MHGSREAPDTPLVIVSADGHVGAPVQVYEQYLEKRFEPEMERLLSEARAWDEVGRTMVPSPEYLDVIDRDGAIASGGVTGAFDVGRRLAELDREGVAGEVLFGKTQLAPLPFFSVANLPYGPEARAAGARAYHRWLSDFMSDAKGRLFGVADPGPCLDVDATIVELRWARDHGFVSVTVPGAVANPALPDLCDDYFDPFWSACAELGLVLSVHAGHGRPQGDFIELVIGLHERGMTSEEILVESSRAMNSTQALDWLPRQVLWQLMFGGVFDRHPALRFVLTEVRADWIPPVLAYLDGLFERRDTSLKAPPSEYWYRHCRVGVSSIHKSEVELRHEIGIDRMMFGMDFPHPEGTWPNTRDWVRDAFDSVPEPEVRQILGTNAVDCYDLDSSVLTTVASAIGPRPELLWGSAEPVDRRLREHFHIRAAYERPPEQVDTSELERLVNQDLARVRSARARESPEPVITET